MTVYTILSIQLSIITILLIVIMWNTREKR